MDVLINKTGQTVSIDKGALPQVSNDFIFAYGLRQILNDCHSSIVAKTWDEEKDGNFSEAVMAAVADKIAALATGDITTRRAAGEPVDPVARRVLRIARERIKSALKAQKGLTIKAYGEEAYDELVSKYIDKNAEALEKQAKAELKKEAETVVDLDL